jgi:hypothetical protein
MTNLCITRNGTPQLGICQRSTVEVVQEDTHKNLDEKSTFYNIQGHLKSSKRQFLAPTTFLS